METRTSPRKTPRRNSGDAVATGARREHPPKFDIFNNEKELLSNPVGSEFQGDGPNSIRRSVRHQERMQRKRANPERSDEHDQDNDDNSGGRHGSGETNGSARRRQRGGGSDADIARDKSVITAAMRRRIDELTARPEVLDWSVRRLRREMEQEFDVTIPSAAFKDYLERRMRRMAGGSPQPPFAVPYTQTNAKVNLRDSMGVGDAFSAADASARSGANYRVIVGRAPDVTTDCRTCQTRNIFSEDVLDGETVLQCRACFHCMMPMYVPNVPATPIRASNVGAHNSFVSDMATTGFERVDVHGNTSNGGAEPKKKRQRK